MTFEFSAFLHEWTLVFEIKTSQLGISLNNGRKVGKIIKGGQLSSNLEL